MDNDCDGLVDQADPDCGAPPNCSEDGTCNTECAPGTDPDCPTCLAKGANCTSNSECCSNKCAGKASKKTCK